MPWSKNLKIILQAKQLPLKIKIYFTVFFLIFSAFFFKFYTRSSPTHPISIALDWTPNVHHMGLFIAKDRSYDKLAGFDFRIQQPSRINGLLAVANGQAQLGVGFPADIVAARLRGLDVLAVAALFPKTTSCLASRPNRGLTHPKNWEGLTYVGWGSEREEAMLKVLMEKGGGRFSTLKRVISPYMDFVSALETGTADLMWIFQIWDGVKAKLRGMSYDVLCPYDIFPGLQHPAPLLVVQKTWAESHKDSLKDILNVIEKGYGDLFNDPLISGEIMAKWVPEVPLRVWKATSVETVNAMAPDMPKIWGWQDDNQWKIYLENLDSLGIIPGASEVYPFHTNNYLSHFSF